jgi:acyl-CoA thioesterase
MPDDGQVKKETISLKTDPIKYAKEVVVGCDPFGGSMGFKIDDVRDSYARLSLEIQHKFCNAEGRTHGGVLFSLADETFAVAVHSRGLPSFALEIKINYFQGSGPGDIITAEATPIDIRKRVSLWNVNLTNQKGEKIAAAQAMAYHFV